MHYNTIVEYLFLFLMVNIIIIDQGTQEIDKNKVAHFMVHSVCCNCSCARKVGSQVSCFYFNVSKV